MNIYIGSDHRGFELKRELAAWLMGKGYGVTDVGPQENNPEDDYPQFGFAVAEAVAKEEGARGIVICGSGTGMAVVANKVRGVRAVLAHDSQLVAAGRRDDDVNVLALGADFIGAEDAKKVVEVFLNTEFAGEERHVRRLKEIADYGELL